MGLNLGDAFFLASACGDVKNEQLAAVEMSNSQRFKKLFQLR